MNASNAKDYLPLVQALIEGKTLQKNTGFEKERWEDVVNAHFSDPPKSYRIKPEPKKQSYRVGLFKDDEGIFFTYSIDEIINYNVYETYETKKTFVRWLTDRIEYELPEGYA